MNNLPSIQSIVKQYGLLPDKNHSKRYGQNFIFDENITNRIVKFARIRKNSHILEIGPGPGGLTRAILKGSEPKLLQAIEYDQLCVKALEYLTNAFPKLHIIHKDALKLSLRDICFQFDTNDTQTIHPITIVSNLPYNIGTELLINWLHEIEYIESMTLMFQKEVADRILAPIHTKDYGRLSILCQLLCDIELGFNLPPTIFTPSPKVDSSVVHFIPKPDAISLMPYLQSLATVTQAAFHQRRKQIKTPLKSIFSNETEKVLSICNIDPQLRAENIPPQQFLMLAKEYFSFMKKDQ